MKNNRYSLEFKEQALLKVRNRGQLTLKALAQELNLPLTTLKSWIYASAQRAALPHGATLPDANLPGEQYSPAQRLLALQQSYPLLDEALNGWCRERGLFTHQLIQWRDAFCAPHAPSPDSSKLALRELQTKACALQKELTRKERALAEAAALLVLQKKFHALLGEEV